MESKTQPRICTDRFIDPTAAAKLAVRANSENRPNLDPLVAAGTHSRDMRQAGVILTGRKWPTGYTLKIAFVDGTPTQRSRVRETLLTGWGPIIGLNFVFVDDPAKADIRVTFLQDGSWSYIGTSATGISKDQPTMCYGWLEDDTSQIEYDRVVLHEFGHAFGYPHEHQHPRAGIPWDRDAVYAYYMAPPNSWSKDDVDHNLFARYSESQTQFGSFDKNSIMLYAIPNSLTLGDYQVGWNTVLSEGDIAFAEWQYPKVKAPPPPPTTITRLKMTKGKFDELSARSVKNKRIEMTHMGLTLGTFDGVDAKKE